jgi:hypothetical protein
MRSNAPDSFDATAEKFNRMGVVQKWRFAKYVFGQQVFSKFPRPVLGLILVMILMFALLLVQHGLLNDSQIRLSQEYMLEQSERRTIASIRKQNKDLYNLLNNFTTSIHTVLMTEAIPSAAKKRIFRTMSTYENEVRRHLGIGGKLIHNHNKEISPRRPHTTQRMNGNNVILH